jgi:cell wall-associated NlpC family hydrolase
MPASPLSLRRHARALGLAFALGLAAGASVAAPDELADPVLKLLAEKNLIPAPAGDAKPEDAPAAPAQGLLGRVQDRASDMVVSSMNFLGVRYRKGGTSAETGFDCSGFTRHVFAMSLGLMLPRRADEQAAAPGFVAVPRDSLRPGDLVFFNTMKRTFSHVGIYIGDNRFIHAPSHGKDVRTDDLSFAYWAKRFTGARRAAVPAASEVHAAAQPVAEPLPR